MTMGKGLGGGYMPIAALLASRQVVSVLQQGTGAFSHGQTYQGHPIACAAGLAVQRIIQQDDLVANVRKQGALLGRLLKERLSSHIAVGDIRGKGLFWGIEFVKNKNGKESFDPSVGVAMGIHELGKSCVPFLLLDRLLTQVQQACRNLTTSPSIPALAAQTAVAATTSSLRQRTMSPPKRFDRLSKRSTPSFDNSSFDTRTSGSRV